MKPNNQIKTEKQNNKCEISISRYLFFTSLFFCCFVRFSFSRVCSAFASLLAPPLAFGAGVNEGYSRSESQALEHRRGAHKSKLTRSLKRKLVCIFRSIEIRNGCGSETDAFGHAGGSGCAALVAEIRGLGGGGGARAARTRRSG